MAVYVDALANHGWKLGWSCHLIADTEAELHDFARSIGLKREWFQPVSSPHYDLIESRRARAISRGALPLERRDFARKLRELRRARNDV